MESISTAKKQRKYSTCLDVHGYIESPVMTNKPVSKIESVYKYAIRFCGILLFIISIVLHIWYDISFSLFNGEFVIPIEFPLFIISLMLW